MLEKNDCCVIFAINKVNCLHLYVHLFVIWWITEYIKYECSWFYVILIELVWRRIKLIMNKNFISTYVKPDHFNQLPFLRSFRFCSRYLFICNQMAGKITSLARLPWEISQFGSFAFHGNPTFWSLFLYDILANIETLPYCYSCEVLNTQICTVLAHC